MPLEAPKKKLISQKNIDNIFTASKNEPSNYISFKVKYFSTKLFYDLVKSLMIYIPIELTPFLGLVTIDLLC